MGAGVECEVTKRELQGDIIISEEENQGCRDEGGPKASQRTGTERGDAGWGLFPSLDAWNSGLGTWW